MKQIYLNTTDEAAFLAACDAHGLIDEDGELITVSLSPIRYDIISFPNLRKPTGFMLTDSEGNQYEETIKIDGYCAMALVEDQHAESFLAEIQVNPSSPVVKFAGY